MIEQLVFRVLIGGSVVSAFSVLGDVFKPKSFAGLFGAAPSVALATLGLAIVMEGHAYGAAEARSMTGGAVAFFVYAFAASRLMMRYKWPALQVTIGLVPLWLATALGFWLAFLR